MEVNNVTPTNISYPVDSQPVSPPPQIPKHSSKKYLIIFCGLLVVLLSAGYLVQGKYMRKAPTVNPSPTPLSSTSTPTPSRSVVILPTVFEETTIYGKPLPTMPSPLAGMKFPNDPISYPKEWPEELVLPQQFLLLQTTTGPLIDPKYTGRLMYLRYKGSLQDTANILVPFFTKNKWSIEHHALSNVTFMILMERKETDSTGSVIYEIDPEVPGYIRLYAVMRL